MKALQIFNESLPKADLARHRSTFGGVLKQIRDASAK